jgi:hypothetical protein
VNKKEKEESITDFVIELSNNLPMLEFYQNVFPTNAVKSTIAEIFAEVNDVVTYAVSYYRTSRFGESTANLGWPTLTDSLGKLMDVLLETKEDRFSTCKSTIAGLVLRLNALRDVGHIAQQADIKEVVEASGAGECHFVHSD